MGRGCHALLAAAVLVWACLAARTSGAQVCPAVVLKGPDAALIAEVRRHCRLNDVSTATTSFSKCASAAVLVRPDSSGLRLKMLDSSGPPERLVSNPATAASLIAAWTAPSLVGLSWLDSGSATSTATLAVADAASDLPPGSRPILSGSLQPVSMTLSASASPAPMAPPEGIVAPAKKGRLAPKVPEPVPAATPATTRPAFAGRVTRAARQRRWWLGASGTASADQTFGTELEVARSTKVGRFDISPALRVGYGRRPNEELVAGADLFTVAAGAHLGHRWRFDGWAFMPGLAATGQLRHVMPRQSVGVIACAPDAPCTTDSDIPGPAPTYQALTVWAEANVTSEVPLSRNSDLRLSLSMAVNPGYIDVGAPKVPASSETNSRTRAAPRLSRWSAKMQVGLQWQGP